MAIDRELAERLSVALTDFVAEWVSKNGAGGTMEANVIVSAMISYAGAIISGCPDPSLRIQFLCNAVQGLVGGSNADVGIAVCDSPEDMMNAGLAFSRPAGRA